MTKTWGVSFFFLFLCLSVLLLALALSAAPSPFSTSFVPKAKAVPALFIFGDSTIDVGTNNDIQSSFKANYPPYGIDFPGSIPTGRFSNGFNSADSLAQKLGFRRSPPPFLDLVNQTARLKRQIVHGVNFASGGSGLLEATGTGGVITFGQQIQQFARVRGKLVKLLGAKEASCLLSKSIILISVGSNDIFLEFFVNHTSHMQQFVDSLNVVFEDYIKTLHSLGARKFGIVSVPAIGCCPYIRSGNDTGGCSEELNDFARTYYSAIEPMLQKLSCELEDMKYSLGNAYELMINFINNPPPAGIKELQKACCGGGNAQEPCTRNATVCENRKEYLFWDAFHPTEIAAQLAVAAFYNGTGLATPINFKQLAES